MTSGAGRSLLKSASIVSAAYLASRLMGYWREALLAARFGASHITDAYLVAQEIPNFLFYAIGGALVMVFIPIYREVAVQQGAEPAQRLFRRMLAVTAAGAAALMLIGWALGPVVVPWLVPGLPPEVQQLAVDLTAVMMPMMVLLGISATMTAVLNAQWHFLAPALVPLIGNLFVVGCLTLVRRPEQVYWVAGAAVVGALAGVLAQLPALRRQGVAVWQGVGGWRDPALARIWQLLLPVALTTGATQLQAFATRFSASSLAEGSISALNYAIRVNSVPYGVVGVAFATVLYPGMAQQAASGRTAELQETVGNGLRLLAYMLLPMAAGLLVFGEPLVRLFLQRGAFDPRATALTADALRYYALGVLFFGWLDFLSRSFVVLQDALTPMWSGLLMVAASLVLNQWLVGPMAQGGLALSTTLSTGAAVVFLFWRLRRKLGGAGGRELVRSVTTHVVTAAAGGVSGWLIYRQLPGSDAGAGVVAQLSSVLTGLIVVIVVYVGLGLLLGATEGRQLLGSLRARLRRS